MKKFGVFFLFAAILFRLFALHGMDVTAEEAVAGQVELAVTCSDREKDCLLVLDGRERTKIYVQKRTTFTVRSQQTFRSLYLKFEKECEWFITLPDGKKLKPGDENYIHKYITLEQEINSFKLTLPAYSGLTDIYAFTAGNPPEWVQLWNPPCERADLMVMPAHADDEFLWFGGAMPYYAGELGYDVQVVYLTNHNNATIRNHERLNALWHVGVRNYPVISPFLDVNDSRYSADAAAKEFGGYRRVMAFQVEQVRRFKPRVILAHDIKGEYGHGAHMLDAKTILEAAEISNDPSQYPQSAKKYGTYQVQKCYLHLWKENAITVSWSDKVLTKFGGKTALEMAKEGFECNKSQIISVKVEEKGRYDCRKFGLAYTTVGNDTPGVNDFFEHIDLSDKPGAVVPDTDEGVSSEVSFVVSDTDVPVSSSDEAMEERSGHTKEIVLSAAVLLLLTGGMILLSGKKRKSQ